MKLVRLTGLVPSFSCWLDVILSIKDESDSNQEWLVDCVVWIDEEVDDDKNSFHSGSCFRCAFDDGKVGAIDQSSDSSFDVCRWTNGSCTCAVKETLAVGILVTGHDSDDQLLGDQEQFDAFVGVWAFGFESIVVMLFWWWRRSLIWTSISGVLGDWIQSIRNDDDDWTVGSEWSLFGRWIGPRSCWGNDNGSILTFK